MATNFNENSIVSRGGFKPSSKDTPLDIRTRVETEQDIYEIPNPYIGMIVYVKDTGKRFEILTLKEVDTGLTTKNVVDTYKQFTVDLEEYANIEDVPTKVSELENDRGYATERFVDSKIETINNTLNSNTNTINTINSNINTINSNINTINTEIDNINTDLIGVSESIEGSWISVDSKDGYLKDIEILGNTVQNQNDLADIRSVGDKLENQELYEIPVLSYGKNLYNESKMVLGMISQSTGEIDFSQKTYLSYEYYIKVKPSTTYVANKPNTINVIFYYDKDKKYIGNEVQRTSFITPSNCEFMRFRIESTVLPKEFQLEEGTVATPYEPYQEHKLTILSPVQLEKVGDVADRIICKDGVWGVEKNIYTKVFDGSERISINKSLGNVSRCSFYLSDLPNVLLNESSISNKLKFILDYNLDEPHYYYDNGGGYLFIYTNELDGITPTEWCKKHNLIIKYPTTQPTFIPLPHDQQIKLRTFANKTNIHFLTEIEPTLKAQVPKSIGATVNTHTEQIDNLSKELDKVKKLEESTVSTVTTESDFTTVTETSNGYFEDVKLEGRTLVNKLKQGGVWFKYGNSGELTINNGIYHYERTDTGRVCYMAMKIDKPLQPNTKYTIVLPDFILNGASGVLASIILYDRYNAVPLTKHAELHSGVNIYAILTKDTVLSDNIELLLYIGNSVGDYIEISPNMLLIEGDHTQNPPEYFEGIKSVGQDADDIIIATTNAPMFFGKGGKK